MGLQDAARRQAGSQRRPRRVAAAWVAGAAVLLAAFISPPALTQEPTERELHNAWMAIYLQQQRIGYAHTRTVERQAGEAKLYVSSICQEMTLSRGATSLKMIVDQEIEEDAAGRLIRFTQKIDQGRVVQESRGEVKDGKLVLTMGSGLNAQVQSFPAPVALCPWAAEQVSRAKGYEPGFPR